MDFQPEKGRKRIHLDMTPLVDVAFLLLTFFMLTAQFSNQNSAKVVLPKSKSGGLAPQTHSLTMSLDQSDQITVKLESQTLTDSILFYKPNTTATVNSAELDSLLNHIVRADSALQIILRADKDIPYGRINEIIQLLKQNHVKKFNLLTEGN